jgi:hypothetical protein
MSLKYASLYLWITCFIVLFAPLNNALSQVTQARNVIYIEGFGPGILYSVNYERYLSETTTARIGFSSWTKEDFSFTGIPLLVNYLVGNGNSKLELGIGLEYIDISTGDFSIISGSGSSIVGIGSIGYRYQPSDGGMHFRLVLNPMLIMGEIRLTAGISIGVCF